MKKQHYLQRYSAVSGRLLACLPTNKRVKVLLRMILLSLITHLAIHLSTYAQIQGSGPATLNVGTSGALNITWYKDNVLIGGANGSAYSATVAGTYYAKYTDPGTSKSCTSATITLTIIPTADLGITLTPLTQTNNKGETQQYSISVVNNGPATAPNAIVEIPIPQGRTFLAATPSQGSYDATTKRWTIGSLTNGATVTMTLSIRID